MLKLDSDWKTVTQDYRLLEVLGQGSGGIVVKAIHKASNKIVAVKRIDVNVKNLR